MAEREWWRRGSGSKLEGRRVSEASEYTPLFDASVWNRVSYARDVLMLRMLSSTMLSAQCVQGRLKEARMENGEE